MKKGNEQYEEGKSVIFIINDTIASVGIITKIIPTDNGILYKVKEFPEQPTEDEWKYYTVKKCQLIDMAERK